MLLLKNNSFTVDSRLLLPRDIHTIKNLLGGRLVGNFWSLPKRYSVLQELQRHPLSIPWSPEVQEWYDQISQNQDFPDQASQHPSWNTLLEYQKDAVTFLTKTSGLLALDPGLGKSAVSVVASELIEAKKVLVVSPLSLLYTWEREYQKWSRNQLPTLCYRDKSLSPLEEGWTIVNYDLLARSPHLFWSKWDVIILDESVMVKNRKTRRFKQLKTIVSRAERVWELSGSPVTKAVDDLWSQFHLLFPRDYTSYWRFAQAYCIIEDTPWGKNIVSSKPYSFPEEFQDIMMVKSQRDVLDLPETLYETIDIDLLPPQEKMYRDILKKFLIELSSGEILPIQSKVAQLTRLLQVSSSTTNIDPGTNISAKHQTLLELLEIQYIQKPGIFWVYWKASAGALYHLLLNKGYSVQLITGDTPQEDRDKFLQQYKKGKIDYIILSLAVGKYGLTLTNTKTVVYVDKTFSMDDYIQSLHRVKRLGLDHTVLVVSLHARHTVDSLVEENLAGKSFDLARISNADLVELLRSLGR